MTVRTCFAAFVLLVIGAIATEALIAAEASAKPAAAADQTWLDKYVAEDSQRFLHSLLGLNKEELLTRMPEQKPYQPGVWRHSKDLATFTRTWIDTGEIIELRYKNGTVSMVREGYWRGYESGTKDELTYGKWLVAGKSLTKK